jgi:hypothetical protein
MSAIFPITYFGSISYYKDLIDETSFIFEVHEHFVKQSIRNRTRIATANGVMELSVPVIKPNGSKTATKEILVSDAKDWRKDHWRAIESAYKHAAYFEHYGEEVKMLIYQTTSDLVGFNLLIMERIQTWLDLPYSYVCSSEFVPMDNQTTDYRFGYSKNSYKNEYQYFQVFQDKYSFKGDLSILDALFNLGPMARKLFIA